MSLLLTMLAVGFTKISRSDPISQERQAVFGTVQDGNTLGITCKPDSHELAVVFVPDNYHGAGAEVPLLWKPRASSRFSGQTKPEIDAWSFDGTSLSYFPVVLGGVKRTAAFIDALARDHEFNIRYEAWPNDVRTVTISYELSVGELRDFLAECGAPRVNARLKEMGSIAAPID